jgi:hypothetical protein
MVILTSGRQIDCKKPTSKFNKITGENTYASEKRKGTLCDVA